MLWTPMWWIPKTWARSPNSRHTQQSPPTRSLSPRSRPRVVCVSARAKGVTSSCRFAPSCGSRLRSVAPLRAEEGRSGCLCDRPGLRTRIRRCQGSAPSWPYEVDMGATTVWESWAGVARDGQPRELSLSHYAFGAVDDFLFRRIAGIRPGAPGYSTIEFAPDISAPPAAPIRPAHDHHPFIVTGERKCPTPFPPPSKRRSRAWIPASWRLCSTFPKPTSRPASPSRWPGRSTARRPSSGPACVPSSGRCRSTPISP
ncbi:MULTISPECIES: hypothetical protein [unclassified Streptomyces]|uniref:alpha-L-rhamnosidase-related protein n=1 Tax=unclassified Streptomyces TaxID=2593676 RepID=UPI00336A9511